MTNNLTSSNLKLLQFITCLYSDSIAGSSVYGSIKYSCSFCNNIDCLVILGSLLQPDATSYTAHGSNYLSVSSGTRPSDSQTLSRHDNLPSSTPKRPKAFSRIKIAGDADPVVITVSSPGLSVKPPDLKVNDARPLSKDLEQDMEELLIDLEDMKTTDTSNKLNRKALPVEPTSNLYKTRTNPAIGGNLMASKYASGVNTTLTENAPLKENQPQEYKNLSLLDAPNDMIKGTRNAKISVLQPKSNIIVGNRQSSNAAEKFILLAAKYVLHSVNRDIFRC